MALSTEDKQKQMFQQSLQNFLAPIVPFLEDESVSEIMINGPHKIFIERKGRIVLSDAKFRDDNTLGAAVRNIAQFVGRVLNADQPRMDARLPDGSRVHVIIPPLCRAGVSVTIRKFSKESLTMDKLLSFGSITPRAVEFLDHCVKIHRTIMVSGGTGSGKTSLLNVLSALINPAERILVIEDSAELQIQQDHVVNLETRPPDKNGKGAVSIRDLMHSALRMRPDRIIIGEIRSGEALDLLQATTSGHSGSMGTVHANNPRDTLSRLETLSMYSGVELPLQAIRAQVSSGMQVVVQTNRFSDGSRKITHITEILELDDAGRYQTRDIFRFKVDKTDDDGKIHGRFMTTGYIPSFLGEMQVAGIGISEDFFKEGLI
ncbi:CpaF family protein [Candidatus Sumerlaeota bacterium]|nr:CpaF family protein [Candidatus Sumerlaeota bacterium]